MICSCTCTGGSASALERSRKRGAAAAASCRVCGGKQLVDGSGSRSRSMVSTVGVELASVINTGLTWKKVTKGNRSARKPIARSFKNRGDLFNKDPKTVDMPVSESEKLGVTVLGRRFSDKIEHVPIKKRRFVFRSPSPPPRTHSPHPEETEMIARSQSVLYQESFPNSTAKQHEWAIDTAISSELGKAKNADKINTGEVHSNQGGNLSILAAVACGDSSDGGASKEDENFHAGISNDGTDSGVSAVSKEHDVANGKDMEVPVLDESEAILSNLPSNKDDTSKCSVLDDRSRWDLNVIMDAWDDPCNDPNMNLLTNAVCSTECHHKQASFEDIGVHGGPEDTQNAVEWSVQPMDHSAIPADVHENITDNEDIASLIPGTNLSNRKVPSMDIFTVANQNTSLHKMLEPLESDSAHYNVLEKETKNVQNMGSTVPALLEHTKEPSMVSTFAVPNELLSTLCVSNCTSEDGEILSSHEPTEEEACVGHSLHTGADHTTVGPLFKECIDEASSFDTGLQIADGSIDAQCGSSPQVEKQLVSVPDTSIPQKASGRSEVADIVWDLQGYAPEKVSTNDVKPSQATLENAITKSDSGGAFQLSYNIEDSTKDNVVVNDENLQNCDVYTADDENAAGLVSSVHINPKEASHNSSKEISHVVDALTSVSCLGSEEASKSCVDDRDNCSGKIDLEEGSFEDSDYESDKSPHDGGHILGVEKVIELQDGYDSQYEDGELREPVVHSWEEDFGDEGDAERVDYGSDNRGTYGFDGAADFSDSMAAHVDEGMNLQKERSARFSYVGSEVDQIKEKIVHETNVPVPGSSKLMAVKQHDGSFVRGDAAKESGLSTMKFSGWDLLPEGGRGEFREIKNQASACTDGLDGKDSMAGVVRREIPSRPGPTSTYVLLRNDRASVPWNRSNNFDDANSRDERDFGSVKSIGRGGSIHLHGRGRGGDRRVDSFGRHWGPNCNSPSYYIPAAFVHSGPKNAAVAAAAKLESNGFVIAPDGTIVKAGSVGPGDRVRRQSANGSPQAVHRSLIRRGSPSDSVHMGLSPVGERSPDRVISIGRGRPVGYGPRVVGRGSRGRYNGSTADDNIGSLHTPHPLARRERSFSPLQRRGVPRQSRSRTRSRSRSVTHSPRMWPSPRGRNGCGPGFRQCSRSPPNFRYETRMDRVRSPNRRPGFGAADHMIDFAAAHRNHGSPPPRWVGERKDVVDHFRDHGFRQRPERSSPGRGFRRTQRFNMVDSPIRLRPDEYYRPVHPGRFSEMVGTGRGTRCDGSDDDRRKQSDKYGMRHPGRRFDADDNAKRFRYDPEDTFTVYHSRGKDASDFHRRGSPKDCVRGIDNRLGDGPRRPREEKGNFRYGRDGKFNANSSPKPFGVRDCDEEIAPRRRPS